MMNQEELINVKGGANWVAIGIGSTLVSFLDGYLRPLKCNKWK